VILGAAVLLACKAPQASATTQPSTPASTTAGSPASAHCAKQGGTTEVVDGPEGRAGVCVFLDGSRCEEFRFMRGTCTPASCFEPDGVCGS
jgi:putative hemolysin